MLSDHANSLLQKSQCLLLTTRLGIPELVSCLQVELVCLNVVDGPFSQPVIFFRCEGQPKGINDSASRFFLDLEDVFQRAIIGFSPEVLILSGMDELGD